MGSRLYKQHIARDMYGAAEFLVKRVEECRTLAWFANPELQLEPADLSSRLGMWSCKISSKIASHGLIPHKGLCKYRKCSIHFRVFHVCETWLIWEPTMIIFLCVVYGDVTEIAKPGRTKVVVYLPVSGPPQRPSLVLWQASENWCLGQCELLPSDCPGFQGILEGWSWWMYMRFISKIGKVQMCPTPLYRMIYTSFTI